MDPYHLQENVGHVVENFYKEIALSMQKKEETKETTSITDKKEKPPWKEIEIIGFLTRSTMRYDMSDESTVLINLREIRDTGTTWIEQGRHPTEKKRTPKKMNFRQEEGEFYEGLLLEV